MNDNMTKLESITESTLAKFITRLIVPAMLAVITGFLLQGTAYFSKRLDAIDTKQSTQSDDIVAVKSDVRDLNTRMQAQVIHQVDSNTHSIEKLDDRVQLLERSVKTP